MNRGMGMGSGEVFNFMKKPGAKKKIIRIVVFAVVLIFAISLFATTYYTVSDKEVAVVTTFGKVTGVAEAGMHFKLPFGMQKVYYVDVNEIKTIEIGYRTQEGGASLSVDDESRMITGDFNIINVDFFVEYRISDPERFVFGSGEPEKILKMLIQSQIRNVIGSYEIDPILTESKDRIQSDIKELTLKELEAYDIGVTLLDVKIQDSEPPTAAVSEAFAAVKNADSGAKTAVNNANAYKNTKDAEAAAREDAIRENAEYLRKARINEAHQEVAMFNAMYDEYVKFPAVTKTRMYYECIEKVFPGVTIYIDTTGNGDILKLLPLENGGETKTNEGGTGNE